MMPINATTPCLTDEQNNAALNYPRTGKRGVPQQFPRRLFEMLQSETKLIETSPDHPKIIFWSDSGKAFRIADVADFSAAILPKYFRTKKFSSFQRNLNLYGFAKVRRGPETDMYAHPAFVRDQADTLSHLRKLTSTSSSRRRAREVPVAAAAAAVATSKKVNRTPASVTRSVSPSPSQHVMIMAAAANPVFQVPLTRLVSTNVAAVAYAHPAAVVNYGSPKHTPMWAPIHQVPSSPESLGSASMLAVADHPPPLSVGRGRLDLLAMAMEQAAAMQQPVV